MVLITVSNKRWKFWAGTREKVRAGCWRVVRELCAHTAVQRTRTREAEESKLAPRGKTVLKERWRKRVKVRAVSTLGCLENSGENGNIGSNW